MEFKSFRPIQSHVFLLLASLLLGACGHSHADMLEEFETLKSQSKENYPVVYAYATYLSTSTSISPEEAVPLILEMISWDYHAEARFCVDNLERNGIRSWDLAALRGLCYFNELQPELALAEVERALEGDPDNAKIRGVLAQMKGGTQGEQANADPLEQASALIAGKNYGQAERLLNQALQKDPSQHRALFLKGMIRLHHAVYDSAQFYFTRAASLEGQKEYLAYAGRCGEVMEADRLLSEQPGAYQAYLEKSQHLAAMGLYEQAQHTLTLGVESIPGNMNLVLAKALVWVQAGEREKARSYLEELERRGMQIDPAIKKQILNPQN